MKELIGTTGRGLLGCLLVSLALVGCGDAGGGGAQPDAAPPAADAAPPDLPPPPPGYNGPVLLTHPLFVAGTRLKVEHVTGADGARDDLNLWDSLRMETCRRGLAEDGKVRCLPEAHPGDHYSDAACTMPLALVRASACVSSYYRDLPSRDGPSSSRLWRANAAPPQTPVYERRPGGCGPITPGPGDQIFVKGDPVDPTLFVEATAVDEVQGRDFPVAAQYDVFADGAKIRRDIVDTRTGARCDFETAPDGTQRCFPVGPGGAVDDFGSTFADEACTIPVSEQVPADQPVTLVVRREIRLGATRLFRVKDRYQGPLFEPFFPNKCKLSSRKTLEGYVRYHYEPADEVPPSELGRVEPWPDGGSRLRQGGALMTQGALFPRAHFLGSFLDPVFDQECTFQQIADGTFRCVPRGSRAYAFADSACSVPVFRPEESPISEGTSKSARHLVLYAAGATCQAHPVEVHALGRIAPAVYFENDGRCEPLGAPSGYFFPGAPVDPDLFVAGELRRD